MNLHHFYIGKSFDCWQFFGAHPIKKDRWIFRTYAPNARSVQLYLVELDLILDMAQEGQSGIYEVTVSGIEEGTVYLYRIEGENGQIVDHTDPFAFASLKRPQYASVTERLDFHFHDDAWMKKRQIGYNSPINIYEMHLGSWRTNENQEPLSYREIAVSLIEYLKVGHYTHVEFMPLTEHPVDESWGYQVSGFFSATSRYGSPEDFAYLVDQLHQNDIGVLLDFVPVHFALDDYALALYDGTALYEYPAKDTGHSEWGSRNFNYYRGEVRSFLQSSADFWISQYHLDGLRMDAISNAIYWQGNQTRGVNEGAIEFIQEMNQGLTERYPNVMKIAEDSTSYVKVTAPVRYDGLGFDYKWDMGWMNDTLEFFKSDSAFRGQEIGKLTWSMEYFYQELFVLALSHDEVVHGKKSILDKMPGDYDDKFSQARLLYLYMFAHPGKKLNFMGYEFGQFSEWSEKHALDWNLLDYPAHRDLLGFIRGLNALYLKTPALYEQDYNSGCFRYVETNHSEVLAFERSGADQRILAVFNFGKNKYGEDDPLKLKLSYPVSLTRIFATSEETGLAKANSSDHAIVVKYPKTQILYPLSLQIDGFSGILYKEDRLEAQAFTDAEENQSSEKDEEQKYQEESAVVGSTDHAPGRN